MTWPARNHDSPTQLDAIRELMLAATARGDWLTLAEIAGLTEFGETSISAQLRHLRKRRFGCYRVEKRRRALLAADDDAARGASAAAAAEAEAPWEYAVRAPLDLGDADGAGDGANAGGDGDCGAGAIPLDDRLDDPHAPDALEAHPGAQSAARTALPLSIAFELAFTDGADGDADADTDGESGDAITPAPPAIVELTGAPAACADGAAAAPPSASSARAGVAHGGGDAALGQEVGHR